MANIKEFLEFIKLASKRLKSEQAYMKFQNYQAKFLKNSKNIVYH